MKLSPYQILEQVVRCCLENAASVAKTFLTSDAVVIDIKEVESIRRRPPMPTSGDFCFPKEVILSASCVSL
jgi:hypothetical protein